MAKKNVTQFPVDQQEQASTVQQSADGNTQTQGIDNNRCILELSHAEARQFFLKAESYCNFDLPPYIVFDKLLAEIDKKLSGKELRSFTKNGTKPRDYHDLNHTILNNKDGRYAWRPLQLTHPALYVSLVHKITEETHWTTIRNRFSHFSQNPRIKCISYPVESLTPQKDKAEQILHWWQELEQRSIEFALDYGYLIQTDITDCYGSIYTHSIAWAIHGKDVAKQERQNKSLIGNIIDSHIQDISYGQTNSIPQGSVLMDFIAEMLLGYADSELSEKIEACAITDYHILRYRDDYRIFINNPQDGERIVKILTEIMIDLGLKLNPSKTLVTNQVIRASIKPDKLHWIGQKQKERNLQKQLLIIHSIATKFPNSGSIISSLDDYYKRISRLKSVKILLLPLISIITDIAYHNPKAYAISSAILSKFINLIEGNDQKRAIMDKIKKRFAQIPHTGHLQIWLQRITITFDKLCDYEEPICQLVAGGSPQIWNMDWLSPRLSKLISPSKIVDRKKIEELSPVITNSEVEVFMSKSGNFYS